jgi:hypothetical protein
MSLSFQLLSNSPHHVCKQSTQSLTANGEDAQPLLMSTEHEEPNHGLHMQRTSNEYFA